ncbi:MAG: GAF domain-containing protein [Anaerolineales bacterium]|nr:GAF domain-containing protein [Anaerolineales bacterium]
MKQTRKSEVKRKSVKSGKGVGSRRSAPREIQLDFNAQGMRQIIDLAGHFIFVKDAEGKYILVNQAFVDAYRDTVGDLIGKTDADFPISPETAARLRADDLEVIRSRKLKHVLEDAVQNKDGTVQVFSTTKIPFVNSESNELGVLGVSVEITEFKEVEKALRASETRLLAVLEASPIPLLLSSQADGIVLYANSSLGELLRQPLTGVIGRKMTDLSGNPKEYGGLSGEFARTGSLRDRELRVARADGSTAWVALSSEKIMLDGQACVLSVLHDITERKRAELLQAAMYQIGEAANKAVGMDDLYRSVHAIIGQVMPAQNFYIALYDEASHLVSFPYYVDEVDGSASIPAAPLGRGMTEYILRTGKSLLSDAANFEELARLGEVELVGPASPIWLGVPLIVDARTIGVIALQDYHNPHVYTERELRMLEYVSGQVAKVIERTRLAEDIQRNNRILTALQKATLPLISQTELSEVLQEILKQATELFNVENGCIYLAAPGDAEITLVLALGNAREYRGVRLERGAGLAGKVWRDGVSMNVADYATWPGRSPKFDNSMVHAVASAPLRSASRVAGVLEVSDSDPGRTFSAEEVELLSRFAELAAIAIENARLYTLSQQELAERKMVEEALRKAEAEYRELVERLPAVVYTSELSETGVWHFVSPQIEALLGFTPEEWKADPNLWYRQVHPDDRKTQEALEEQAFADGEGKFDTIYRMRTRDGREVWVRDTARILPPQAGALPLVQGVLVDITERMQAEALQPAISRISDAASLSGGMEEFYREVHESLRSVMFADNFFIALYDKDAGLVRFPYYVDEKDPRPEAEPLGGGLTSYVIRSGSPLFGKSETMKKLEEEGMLQPIGTRSIDWLGVPLKIENETIGAMAVQTYGEGNRYSLRDLDILKFVSTQVALSIERKQSAENLRSAEARYRTLVEQLPVVVYVNPVEDMAFTIYVSPQINDLLGYTQEEWLKDPHLWQKTLHPQDRTRVLAAIEKVKGVAETYDEEYRLIARDGRVVWIRDQATLLHNPDGSLLFWQGLMLDITEKKRAEERIKLQIERLKALRTVDMFIASGADLRLTLQTILQQTLNQLKVDAADILLLNQSMHILEFSEGTGFRTRGVEQTTLRVGESFAGQAALQREAVVIQDLSAYDSHPLFMLEGFVSYHGIPLIAKGEVKGVLEIFKRSEIETDSEWMDFLESLAGQAALAVDNSSLFDSLQRTNIELGMAYETTLEGWSAALDLRDKETEGHTQRVTDLTLKLAEAMGVSERERVHIRRGALLHDIGKMGIPDRILLKPDTLTSEEWEIMRQHPVYAYNLLSKIEYLRPALEIPYCHHERWDGSGYPRGLKAETIPLPARIFAVVDVWDALCSDRPYRPAWSHEQALNYIQSLSDAHFDPRVVTAFLKLIAEI